MPWVRLNEDSALDTQIAARAVNQILEEARLQAA
jgi:hypothetical protein